MVIAAHDPHRPRRRSRPSASRHAAWQPAGARLLRGGRLCSLSRLARRILPPLRRRGLGLLPDAEPRSSHPYARGRRGPGAGAVAGAPALRRLRQRPRAPDRSSVSGALRGALRITITVTLASLPKFRSIEVLRWRLLISLFCP